ncbi:MAG: Asp/Glu racemase [Alphaproteobacteria bacterium PA2]|nr:MAG: Asp/Glu racemase [Alphaproteobacteria bacterium PA2]
MVQIACLHTAESNVAVFEAARVKLGWPEGALSHLVRPDLLAAAESAGELTPAVIDLTRRALCDLGETAPSVLLTCSTLGPAIPAEAPNQFRADSALADLAVKGGGRVVVICAAPSTLQATGDLFRTAATRTGAEIDIWWVDGAWDMFKAGQLDNYEDTIAAAADRARKDGVTSVALAQASMAGAADKVQVQPPPLTSPMAGLQAARKVVARP